MRIDTICPIVAVEIECDGYIPLVIRFDGYEGPVSSAPKYWRTGDFKHSLIEVAVNPSSGAICKVVMTSLWPIQSEPIVSGEPFNIVGIPSASLSQWSDKQERVDVEQEVIAVLVNRELTVVFGDVEPTSLEKIGCGRVVFLVDQIKELCGIQVGNLSEQEIENIRYAIGDRLS